MTRPPRPASGEVHIWCITLASDIPELTRLEGLLSPNELARADRLLDRQMRDRFVAGRGLLRETLARYLEMGPEHLPIAEGVHGKPFLDGQVGINGALRFNLSHARDLALLAVSGDREVGIDIEEMRDEAPIHDMARISFSIREQEELLRLPPSLQRPAFYRCWTRKEACMKACGSGFSLHPGSFDVSLLPDPSPVLLDRNGWPNEQTLWQMLDLSVPAGYLAALAVEGETPVSVRFIAKFSEMRSVD
jgi:4'-phosphopantetheinyl transferase